MSDTCPMCPSRDVDRAHVTRCTAIGASRSLTLAHTSPYDIPDVTVLDLWAHVYTRTDDLAMTRRIVGAVTDLGWRPVVGSDPKRLWQREDET